MVKALRKKRLFDEDACWVPGKGQGFMMKRNKEKPKETQNKVLVKGEKTRQPQADVQAKVKELKDARPITDAEGLDRAYAGSSNVSLDSQGTLCVSGT